MTTITPAEAMEEIERLKITVSYYRDKNHWHATSNEPILTVASGPTPVDAVAKLLGYLAENETRRIMARPGYLNGMAGLEELEVRQ